MLRTDVFGDMISYVGFPSRFNAALDLFEIRCQITQLRSPQQAEQTNELRTNVATEDTMIRVVAFICIAVDGHVPTVVHIMYRGVRLGQCNL